MNAYYLIYDTIANRYLAFCEMQNEWVESPRKAAVFTAEKLADEIAYQLEHNRTTFHIERMQFIPA